MLIGVLTPYTFPEGVQMEIHTHTHTRKIKG